MFKRIALAAALAVTTASAAHAAINVDGAYDSDYGARTAMVGFDPAAPLGTFQAPVADNHVVGYDIYLSSDENYVYGYFEAAGATPYTWANVYWDVNPSSGSDIGFELSTAQQNVFRPGGANLGDVADILVAASVDGTKFEFAIPLHYFLAPPAGLGLPATTKAQRGGDIRLNLSQSFGYSVAGGQENYGDDRLGVVGIVPEPATWAMMIMGFGAIGAMVRRRSTVVA
jgi:hypothetical protein